jgi:hypothetical protein
MKYLLSFVTSRRPEYRSPFQAVNYPPVVANCYLATTHSLLFVAAGTWLSIRCSATDYSVTIVFNTLQSDHKESQQEPKEQQKNEISTSET